jgi:hypothetical protein
VLEDEEVRLSLSGDADEGLVVILDHPNHFFSVSHFHADGGCPVDEVFEISGFLKGLFRRARGFSTVL